MLRNPSNSKRTTHQAITLIIQKRSTSLSVCKTIIWLLLVYMLIDRDEYLRRNKLG